MGDSNYDGIYSLYSFVDRSYVIGCCKLFKKMGEPVWKFFSPFHVYSVLLNKAGNEKKFIKIYNIILWIVLLSLLLLFFEETMIFVLGSVSLVIYYFVFSLTFTNENFTKIFDILFIFFANPIFLFLLLLIVGVDYLFKIYIFYKLFLKFDKSKKQALLYAIFFPIGVVIVGFDDSKYNNILEKNDDDYLQKMIK